MCTKIKRILLCTHIYKKEKRNKGTTYYTEQQRPTNAQSTNCTANTHADAEREQPATSIIIIIIIVPCITSIRVQAIVFRVSEKYDDKNAYKIDR